MGSLTRRAALAGLLAAGASPARSAPNAPATVPRVAALDWTQAAACLTLGVPPAGVAETRLYARWVREPALPPGTVELGLREVPSLEGLAALAPDLILVDGFSAALRPRLERIAPTLSADVYGDGPPLARAESVLRDLGRRLGRGDRTEAVLAAAEAGFSRARAALGPGPHPPVLPFNLADARDLRVYGAGSLFADALARLGLASAWTGSTSPWGSATTDLSALAAVPDAALVLVDPVPAEAAAMLEGSNLWTGLTAGRRLLRLPAVWPFGEVSAGLRFAELLSAAMAPSAPLEAGDAG